MTPNPVDGFAEYEDRLRALEAPGEAALDSIELGFERPAASALSDGSVSGAGEVGATPVALVEIGPIDGAADKAAENVAVENVAAAAEDAWPQPKPIGEPAAPPATRSAPRPAPSVRPATGSPALLRPRNPSGPALKPEVLDALSARALAGEMPSRQFATDAKVDGVPDLVIPTRPRAVGREIRIAWNLLATALVGALIVRVLVYRGLAELSMTQSTLAWTAILVVAAGAGISYAGRRDVISWLTLADSTGLALAMGAFTWQFPRFIDGTTAWDATQRWQLTLTAAALGLLFSTVLLLGLLRRPQTIASLAFLLSLALLIAQSVLAASSTYLALVLTLAAAAVAAVGWLFRRRMEQAWNVPEGRLRLPRWALSLMTAGISAVAIQITVSRADTSDSIPVIVLLSLLIVTAWFSMFSSRNELRAEEGAMTDWLSWRREMQTGEFETSLFEYTPSPTPGISEWNVTGGFLHGDDLFWRMLDLAPAPQCDLLASVHADDRVEVANALVRSMRGLRPMALRARLQAHEAAPVRWFDLKGLPLENGTFRLSLYEVASDEALESQGVRPSGRPLHDPLTGAANIAYLEQWLHDFALRSRRHSDTTLFVMVEVGDLAQFEQADPRVRDLVLTESAHRLQTACRDGDFVAHVDGPYFAVVANLGTPSDEAGLVARIQAIINGTIDVYGQELGVSGRLIPLHVDPGVVLDQVLDAAAAAFHSPV